VPCFGGRFCLVRLVVVLCVWVYFCNCQLATWRVGFHGSGSLVAYQWRGVGWLVGCLVCCWGFFFFFGGGVVVFGVGWSILLECAVGGLFFVWVFVVSD